MENYVVLQINKRVLKIVGIVAAIVGLFMGTKTYYYKKGAMDAIQYLMSQIEAPNRNSAENSHDGSSL